MMKRKINTLFFILMLSLSACNLGVEQTPEPAITEAVGVEQTTTEAPTEIPPTAVEHKTIPGEFPENPSGVVGDQDSSTTADDHRAPGGDRFTFTRFERPFNSETMDEYYPFIDILEGAVYMDDTWIYVSLALKGEESSRELKGKYGIELDMDVNGGGDWLILASNPVTNEWTTDGVEAWFDTNDDVGGSLYYLTDKDFTGGNGYETLEFDAGVGNDPDLAWVRISPDNPNIVQLAVKTDVLNGSKRFLAGMWAGEDDLDPALFDLSDHYNHEQAGAALIELEIFYPIKQISAVDNTCRMAIGFQPRGTEPGLCPLAPSVAGDTPLEAGCPAEFISCTIPLTAVYVEPVCVCNQP
jgi:hypothetical protein